MAKLIRNGTVVTAADQYQADVLIENGIISQIGLNIEVEGAEIIDAQGLYVFPGGIDPHTHLDMPFEDSYSRQFRDRNESSCVRRNDNNH